MGTRRLLFVKPPSYDGARRSDMAVQATDSNELAEFGYKQELDRSLGSFSSFAAGFSYISILTGVFQLFAFGFAFGGPGGLVDVADRLHRPDSWSRCASRSWPASIRWPGSVYQWSKQHRQRLHVVDGGLDHDRRLDRDRRGGGRRLAGDPAADLDVVPDPRRQGRRRDLPDRRAGPRTRSCSARSSSSSRPS